jgi:hypothetical protein
MLTTAQLGSTNGTPLPQSVGDIAPGAISSPLDVFFTNPSAGGSVMLRLNGDYAGGNFTSSRRVTIR